MARKRKVAPIPDQDLDATILKGLHALVIPVGTITLDDKNARAHDERNIESIAASLKRFKQRKPIVVQSPDMTVRAGNGTLAAAKRNGWTHIAAVVVEETDVEAVAYAIADNRTAELAEWDFQMIGELVERYKLDASEHALGFSPEELASIVATRPWDEQGPGEGQGGEEGDVGDQSVAVVIKVKVIDIPYRARVQTAIQELIEAEFKGLAKVV